MSLSKILSKCFSYNSTLTTSEKIRNAALAYSISTMTYEFVRTKFLLMTPEWRNHYDDSTGKWVNVNRIKVKNYDKVHSGKFDQIYDEYFLPKVTERVLKAPVNLPLRWIDNVKIFLIGSPYGLQVNPYRVR